jgi:hypothetical protein
MFNKIDGYLAIKHLWFKIIRIVNSIVNLAITINLVFNKYKVFHKIRIKILTSSDLFPNNSIFKTIAIISCKIYKVPLEHLIKIPLLTFFKTIVTGEINKTKIIFRMEEIHKEV